MILIIFYSLTSTLFISCTAPEVIHPLQIQNLTQYEYVEEKNNFDPDLQEVYYILKIGYRSN
jgi:hypothetical protein